MHVRVVTSLSPTQPCQPCQPFPIFTSTHRPHQISRISWCSSSQQLLSCRFSFSVASTYTNHSPPASFSGHQQAGPAAAH